MLAAQYKAGKTTLNANLVRSLVDDEPFLGAATVHPVTGTITVLDLEMSERQLEHWFASLGIVNDDGVAIVSLRGRASSLNILDDDVRTQWAERLAGTGYLILDPLRPLLDALGLDEHHDAGTLLQAFDALLAEAGIGDALITHHMGHGPERSRGDSRLRDWPDVEWTLVRQGDDPRSPRYLSAYGRDVDQPETLLGYEPDTRRLSIAGGTRKQAAGRAALADVCDLIADGSGDWSGRRIEEEVCSATEHTRQAVREGIALGVREGDLIVHEGPRRAKFYTSSAPVRRSAP